MDKAESEIGGALVYYLGSKQRMATKLANCVAEVCPGGRVLDLFSGMGSASVSLSKEFDVTAVDVQEYSRIMCSALLVGGFEDSWLAPDTLAGYDEAFKRLMWIYGPMVEYEARAIEKYELGNGCMLSNVVEHGCLLPEYRRFAPRGLRQAMEASDERRSESSSYDVPVRHFGGLYFSYLQSIEIAAIRSCLGYAPKAAKDVLLAGLISAASHCSSTVGGQFAQPLKTIEKTGAIKEAALAKACRSRRKSVREQMGRSLAEIKDVRAPRRKNEAVRSECCAFVESAQTRVGAIYADPPYSRYHYSRYYHVLETIALGDDPSVTVNPATGLPSRGVYRANRYQSPFSTLTGASKGFDRLIRACSNASSALVLSYSPYPSMRASTPRMMTIDQLVGIAKTYYNNVDVREVGGIVHSRFSNSRDALAVSDNAEVLIVCRK